MSEKFSDVIEPSIKYGGGDVEIQKTLQYASTAIANEETSEKGLIDILKSLPPNKVLPDDFQRELDGLLEQARQARLEAYEDFRSIIADMSNPKEGQ